MMKTLVVGGTGFLGGRVCKELAAQGHQVSAIVRGGDDDAKVAALRAAGVEPVAGDLKDAASLERACQGMDAVVSTASSTISRQAGDNIETVDLRGQLSLVDAARTAGVGAFVYISFSSNLTTDGPVTAAKRAVEEHLKASGLTYTILRCGFFSEVMLSPLVGFDFANAAVVVFGTGDTELSLLSMDDAARMVALCLDEPKAANQVIDFGGPEALTQHDVVRIFEEVSGRPYQVQHLTEEALRAEWEEAPDPRARSLGALNLDYAHGDRIDMGPVLARFPITLTSVRDYAGKVLAGPS